MTRRLIAVAVLVLALAAGVGAARGSEGDLAAAIAGTAQYRDGVSAAVDAGYGEFRDAQNIACIDNPGVGGMGIHYVNGNFVGDTVLDPANPEALVYEPRHGHLRLVALEYIVFQEAWDAHHHVRPSLFGQDFELVPAGNRYGIPAFYELHAWVWKFNPSGMFEDWNPRVVCP